MKTLVVFYSRSGNTRKVAHAICKKLKADAEELVDQKNRRGILGWIVGGKDAFMRKFTDIGKMKKNASKYDLVIIGTPIWAWKMTPAIRTYLTKNKNQFDKVAFFCTASSHGGEKAFAEMEMLAGKPIATLSLKAKEIGQEECHDKVCEFCESCK